jgi:hypothetical protein
MKLQDLLGLVKKLADYIPRQDVEKFIFKVLLGLWLLFIVAAVILSITLGRRRAGGRYDMASTVEGGEAAEEITIELKRYEALTELVKNPEDVKVYTQCIRRDPFSEYDEAAITSVAEYDFVLKSVTQASLPMVYKGYIELTDRLVGQVNWYDTTKFVEERSAFNGYRIHKITKEMIEATDKTGKKIQFRMNEPVLGDEFEAVLYDNISKKTFNLKLASEIGGYKVIDIAANYVILLLEDEEIVIKK